MSLDSSGLSRRKFLGLAGAALFAPLLPWRAFARPEDFLTISIFHTTDLHGHILPTTSYDGVEDVGGLARCASQIALWRRQNPNAITIDAGDVYQGTEFGFRTLGRGVIECFNQLDYDGWVIGNHEFDWGIEPFREAVAASAMPALAANTTLGGRHLENVRPFVIREFDGFRVGVVGVTTPGMPFWFPPEFLEGFEATDPLEPVRRAIAELRGENVDAVVLAGHMGLRQGGDDFANRTQSLLAEFPEVVAFIGGHTHRDVPNESVRGIPFTQAGYHGIHCGRLDLVFERDGRSLVGVHPVTVLMDNSLPADPVVMSLTAETLDESARALAEPAGELAEPLGVEAAPGKPSDLEKLFGAAIADGLARKSVRVDAVFHGMFWPDGPVPAGPKTVADMWKLIPYENQLVTAELSGGQLRAILRENYGMRGFRSLIGMDVEVSGPARNREIGAIRKADGTLLGDREKAVVAFNTFDAQSGGQRLMILRDILREPASKAILHPVQSRAALISWFRDNSPVRIPATLLSHSHPIPLAA